MTPRPFDAFALVNEVVEPMGSHATLDAALAALSHFGKGCVVVVGLTRWAWHQDTSPEGREAIREALVPHGVRGLEERLAPQRRAAA